MQRLNVKNLSDAVRKFFNQLSPHESYLIEDDAGPLGWIYTNNPQTERLREFPSGPDQPTNSTHRSPAEVTAPRDIPQTPDPVYYEPVSKLAPDPASAAGPQSLEQQK